MAIPMIPFRTVVFSAALGIAASLPAQEPVTPAKPPVEARPDAAAKKNAEQLIRELGNDSYRTRLDAERKLRELGEAALPALREAAAGQDPEVQWRARRVLRQIERGGKDLVERDRPIEKGGEKGQPQPVQPGDAGQDPRVDRSLDRMRREFESLFENFERDFGIDIPRARFFDESFFRDLQEQMQGAVGKSQGMSVQIGPDGAVRVEVQEKNDKGETDKKVYEAPDMETFQRQYPGVLQQNGLFFGLRSSGPHQPWSGTFRTFGGLPRDWTTLELDQPAQPRTWPFGKTPVHAPVDPGTEPPAAPPAGRRLGVSIRPEITPDLREYLGLADDVGMMVEGVQQGTLAEALGLERGDIVTKIGARTIGGPDDVQQALGAIKKGEKVDVEFVRKGAAKTASAAKTEDAEDSGPALKERRLERRPAKSETIR